LPNVSLQNIVIYGTRGVARETHQLIKDLAADGAAVACAGFLVDWEYRESSIIHGLPVLGDLSWLAQHRDVLVTIGIAATPPRHNIVQRIKDLIGTPFITLKHPRCWVGDAVSLGAGTIVAAGALVTTDISIGRHVQLHVGCTIGHDTIIGDFVTVAPGARVSGRVDIGEGVFVGAGAVILPNLKIGGWTTIGAGAVVTKDAPANVTIAGVPARVVAQHPSGWHRAAS
jgi:sugar O-acyltransferase (sialic acid O-acetyltransferase NeuD family)